MLTAMRLHRAIAVLGMALAAAEPASAMLIDLANVTRDTASGLDWLDLPVTANLSFREVLADEGGLIGEGWRHANFREVCQLFATHAGASDACSGDSFSVLGDAPALMALLGPTIQSAVEQEIGGFYSRNGSSAIASMNHQPRTGGSLGWVTSDNMFGDDFASQIIAHFLVRPSDPADGNEPQRYAPLRPRVEAHAPPAPPQALPPSAPGSAPPPCRMRSRARSPRLRFESSTRTTRA